MAAAVNPKPTAAMVRAALRTRYAAPAFALFEEVRNGTGGYGTRSADAIAMGLWPSRGIEIHGIEIKVRRSDWLAELKNPQKADEIAKFCDHWWIAAGDESVVKSGELPSTWGLLVLRGGVLVQKIQGTPAVPEPVDRMFVAALLRRAAHGMEKLQADARHEGSRQAKEHIPNIHKRDLELLQQELERAKKCIADFEHASGVSLSRWNGEELGTQFKRFLDLRKNYEPEPVDQLRNAASFLDRQAASLRDLCSRLEQQRDIAQEHKDAP